MVLWRGRAVKSELREMVQWHYGLAQAWRTLIAVMKQRKTIRHISKMVGKDVAENECVRARHSRR